ncbi:uncharacterized protein LOC103524116 [Trichonephila clavipes]|nr:uncharacterized protein LOC103524116 [Trichonephila clavipes]
MPTSARIVERVTVGSASACRTILLSSLLVVFLVAPDPVFRAWLPSRVHCSQQFLTAHSERSTWPATRRVDQPAVFIPKIRPLSNSLNSLQQLAVRLPPIERAVILSDSTSALQALSNYNENNCLRVQNCRELLGKIKGKIVFQWVPSHCGLWGNERADFLAKKGTSILQNFRRDLTLHSAKLEIKRIFRESFRLTASRVARDKPWSTLCKKSHGIPSSPRAAAVAKFRLLTGHDCLCAHLFRFNLVTSPICVLCDTGQDMTAAHLDECSALNDLNCIVKRYWRARCLMT